MVKGKQRDQRFSRTSAICFLSQLLYCQSSTDVTVTRTGTIKFLCTELHVTERKGLRPEIASVSVLTSSFVAFCVSHNSSYTCLCFLGFECALAASFCASPKRTIARVIWPDWEAADHSDHMMEAEGHVFVTRPIVNAKETVVCSTHSHLQHTFIRRPPRDSNQAQWQRWCLRLLSYNTHTVRAESYNYSDRNWQVVLCAGYRPVSSRNWDQTQWRLKS